MCSNEWADPLRERPPPPFINTRRDGVHAQGVMKVVVFSPNRGGAVVEHCGKYTVGYGAGRGSRPGHRPWSCGDRAGVLAAPASWRLQRAAWSLLWGYCPPGMAWRRSEGPTSQGLVLVKAGATFEGRAHVVRGLRGRESTKEAWGVGSIVAGAVPSTSCTAPQVPTVSSQRPEW